MPLLYLTLFCTLLTQFLQIFGQKFTSSGKSSIVMSFEAVFGTVFSVILGHEKLSVQLILGFLSVFISLIIVDLKDVYSDAKNLRKKDNEK